jgi:hypothetical protein
MNREAGKGDKQRPTDYEKFAENFEKIFGKPNEKRMADMTEQELKQALEKQNELR